MIANARPAKWSILLWWVLASVVSYSAGFPLGLALGKSLLWGWIVGGGLASVAQWYILRRWVAQAGWWIAVSGVGLIVGTGISLLVSQYALLTAGLTAAFASAGATVGLGVGLAQWIMLRLQFRQAGWWVLASTAGYGLGLLAAVNAPVAIPVARALIFGPEFGGLMGVISGVLTGVALLWFLSTNPSPQSTRRSNG